MNLCSHGHEEVCYEGRRCPVCEMESDKDKQIKKLEDQHGNDLDTIFELESKIKDLEGQISV